MKRRIVALAVLLTQLLCAQNTTNSKLNDSLSSTQEIDKKVMTVSSKVQDVFDVIIDELIADTKKPKNIIFLVEVTSETSLKDSRTLLKQGVKVLSKKLDANCNLAIVTYSRSNQVICNFQSVKNKSQLVEAVQKIQVQHSSVDLQGIDLAYKLAEDSYNAKGDNIVVLLRDEAQLDLADASEQLTNTLTPEEIQIKKQNKATIIVTALSLIPDIIRIIK